jgi:uncharacterized protein (TIGR02596 family)
LELLKYQEALRQFSIFMKRISQTSEKARQAFSLIEMLVVVTIIVLLLAFSTPALMRTMQATRLASVGDGLMGAISEAQQIAYAQNVPVELRFFSYSGDFGDLSLFRSYQLFKVVIVNEGTGAAAQPVESIVPAGNLIKLSDGIVVASDEALSPALSGEGITDTKDGGVVPGYSGVSEATYNAIRFMPDGSCRKVGTTTDGLAVLTFQTLPESFFTITYDSGVQITAENLPKNFYTIQIDPFTGKARSYKPGF